MKREVHIRDEAGKLKYTRLIYDEEQCTLNFASGYGFLDPCLVAKNHWKICNGWVDTSYQIFKKENVTE